jgi:hypothetical protein
MDIAPHDCLSEGDPAKLDRRKFLFAGAGVAAASLLPHLSAAAQFQSGKNAPGETGADSHQLSMCLGSRKLGTLEVSSVGMGVQNMHRQYTTTVPYRPEMIGILREAYDRGVSFFDCAEAYGPFENERILGEAIKPFRNKVRITSKFGWNIDPYTGERAPGLNSRPEHIKRAVEGSLKRLRTDRIDLLYQHRVAPQVPKVRRSLPA